MGFIWIKTTTKERKKTNMFILNTLFRIQMKVKCSLWTPTGYEQYIFMFSSFFTTKENNVSVITVKKDFLYSQGWLATTTSIRIYIKTKKNEKVYNLFTNVLLFFSPWWFCAFPNWCFNESILIRGYILKNRNSDLIFWKELMWGKVCNVKFLVKLLLRIEGHFLLLLYICIACVV